MRARLNSTTPQGVGWGSHAFLSMLLPHACKIVIKVNNAQKHNFVKSFPKKPHLKLLVDFKASKCSQLGHFLFCPFLKNRLF